MLTKKLFGFSTREALFRTGSFSSRVAMGWERAIALAVVFATVGCSVADDPPADEILFRVGSRQVTVSEFEQALEISRTAYSWEPEGRSGLLWTIRRRLLVEMIEELLVFTRAEELGIVVTDQELERYEAEIRADYHEGDFEQMFLQQAVSYDTWRRRTRERMLLGKAIEADRASRPAAPPLADALPAAGAPEAGGEPPAPDGRLSPEADGGYAKWIRELAARIPVEINAELWEKLYGT